jgi:hypothetical protein
MWVAFFHFYLRNCSTVANITIISVCFTEYSTDKLQDDVPTCEKEQVDVCKDVDGQSVCKIVNRQKCNISQQTNAKLSKSTNCNSVPRKVCGPEACPIVNEGNSCRNEIKTVRK